jgi:hypothetical protein
MHFFPHPAPDSVNYYSYNIVCTLVDPVSCPQSLFGRTNSNELSL